MGSSGESGGSAYGDPTQFGSGRVPMARQSSFGGGVPIAGQSSFGGDAGGMRQQLAGLMGGGGGAFPYGNPGNPPPPQTPLPGASLAQPPASGGATAAQLAMPTGAPGTPRGSDLMGYTGTGTGDWNYATQGQGSTSPYNYAGFNVSHGVGDAPNKGQVSAASMPGQAGYLAKPTGGQGGFLPK